jgi:hypothetical protein
MKKNNFLSANLICLALFMGLLAVGQTNSLLAQYESATFDLEKQYFNGGQPLPAETYLMITGGIPSDYGQVEIAIYANHKRKKALYSNIWQRFEGNNKGMFEIPVNYKLRSNRYYDFVFRYHRSMKDSEKETLKLELFKIINSHLEERFQSKNRRMKALQPVKRSFNQLNKQVKDILSPYHSNNHAFDGFSPLLLQSMRNFKKNKISTSDAYKHSRDSLSHEPNKSQKKQDKSQSYQQGFQNRITTLQEAAHKDIDRFFTQPLLVKAETRNVSRYPTKNTANIMQINVGYGGVLLSSPTNLNNIEYSTSPYVGLSVALGNRSFSNAFWSNSSVSTGVFISNFKNSSDEALSGPIIGRPYYLAFGYKMFQFLRLNAGASLLENKALNQISVHPFVGASLEINLWLGIGNKKP